jgi:hypothetical protein
MSSDASSSAESELVDIIQQEPMYYVLSQFLETPQNKNIAVIMEELVSEIRQLRLQLAKPPPPSA